MSTPGDRSGNQSIARASRLLRCFVDSPDGLTLAELSKRTDLHPSTAHRMMTALVEGGLIAKGDRDRYRPGIALLALGASATVAVGIDAAVPFLENLAEETGESANLAVKDIDCAVVIAELTSRRCHGRSSAVANTPTPAPSCRRSMRCAVAVTAWSVTARWRRWQCRCRRCTAPASPGRSGSPRRADASPGRRSTGQSPWRRMSPDCSAGCRRRTPSGLVADPGTTRIDP
jgi:hypothetical protein